MKDPTIRPHANPVPEDEHVDGTGHFHDESEGSESLDESLRMVDQPYSTTDHTS